MFLFLDTETHDTEDQRVIQLAYKVDTADTYFNSLYSTGGVPLSYHAMAVHHITEKHLAGKAELTGSDDANTLQNILQEHILVAHNSAFDVEALSNHNITTKRNICTLKIARYLHPELEAHKLQYLRYLWGFDLMNDSRVVAHDALGDVIVLEEVFKKLYQDFKESFPDFSDSDIVENMIEISKRPSILWMCKFGKHKGTLWSEVPRGYLDWIVNVSDFTDEDVKYTAKYYLDNEN